MNEHLFNTKIRISMISAPPKPGKRISNKAANKTNIYEMQAEPGLLFSTFVGGFRRRVTNAQKTGLRSVSFLECFLLVVTTCISFVT